jgi:hypothetical protein
MKKPSPFPNMPPRSGTLAWWLRLSRWLLVALLIADQVGAPLHRHHHDSGVDAAWSAPGAAHDAEPAAFAEDLDPPDTFTHATLAVRLNADAGAAAPAQPPASDAFIDAQLACLRAVLALAPTADDGGGLPRPGWQAPPEPSHRSLPPAGRAPPLHA